MLRNINAFDNLSGKTIDSDDFLAGVTLAVPPVCGGYAWAQRNGVAGPCGQYCGSQSSDANWKIPLTNHLFTSHGYISVRHKWLHRLFSVIVYWQDQLLKTFFILTITVRFSYGFNHQPWVAKIFIVRLNLKINNLLF